MSERFQELLGCFRKGHPGHCSIVDGDSTWEGLRWTETLPNGDSLTIGGMVVPLHTQFLVCNEHLPEEERREFTR